MISLTDICAAFGVELNEVGMFAPGIAYYCGMDWLLLLTEDVSYRADPLVPGVVDVLWHPYENRIVGLKIWDASRHPNSQRILTDARLL